MVFNDFDSIEAFIPDDTDAYIEVKLSLTDEEQFI